MPIPPIVFDYIDLALPDSEAELTEGLLLYLEIDESSLEPRDLERLRSGDIRVDNGLVLVSITGNNREYHSPIYMMSVHWHQLSLVYSSTDLQCSA